MTFCRLKKMPDIHNDNRILAEQFIADIKENRQQGASELGRLAVSRLEEFAMRAPNRSLEILQSDLFALATALRQARPSMSVIRNLIDQWQLPLQQNHYDTTKQLCTAAKLQSDKVIDLSRQATLDVAKHACSLIQTGHTIMTHSYGSTVSQIFSQLAGQEVSAIITESQPGCEGARLARELSALKLPALYITDAEMGLFVDKADLVLIGADTLLADGSVVNKAGTYLLALAALDRSIPLYVCAESFKQSELKESQVELESMAVDEIALTPLPGVQPQNIYFDITPARLISGWVNEQGIYHYD